MNAGGHGTLPRFARTERVKRDKVASAAVPKLQGFTKGVAVTMRVSASAKAGWIRATASEIHLRGGRGGT